MSRPSFTREQAAAIADRAGSALLAANAGSGKTAVMVERFVEDLEARVETGRQRPGAQHARAEAVDRADPRGIDRPGVLELPELDEPAPHPLP